MTSIDNLYQLRQWTPPYRPAPIISEGLLLPNTVMMLFGAAGAWKTMNTIHLSRCIATGTDWFGFKTNPAIVYTHQVELPKKLIQDRILKYYDSSRVHSNNLFFKTPDDEIQLDTTVGIAQLAKDIEEVKRRSPDPELPVVLILDPLYLHLAGHISDEYEVRKFQRNVNAVRKKYNLTVILIHHSRLTRVDNSGKVVDLAAEEIMRSS